MRLSPFLKPIISLTIDLTAALLCSFLALWIRLGDQIAHAYDTQFYQSQAALLVISCFIANVALRVYEGTWRFFNYNYFLKLCKYSILSCVIFSIFLLIDDGVNGYPRSAIIINTFLLATVSSAPRWLYRFLSDQSYINLFPRNIPSVNVLIIGLNKSSEAFLKELGNMREINYKVVGILDEKNLTGRSINDIKVLGTPNDLKKIANKLSKKGIKIQRVLVSPEFYIGGKLKELLKLAESLSIPISSFPKLSDLNNNFGIRPIKSIPLEDLLRRPQREHNHENIFNLINNKRVLVTGAGGSIGSEIARQVAANDPMELAILDNSEFLLYEIEQELKEEYPDLKLTLFLTDIRDESSLNKNITKFKPKIVLHAAALKHVPMIESNQLEAVKTNIIGTNNLIRSSAVAKVQKFIMISTDKAVNPSSFMGATKRIAETICYLNSNELMQISVVRFGNVLGSNGSVVPIFERQIAKGGPITVTHKNATRYFMTIKEAVFLVLQSSINQQSNFEVYILDMGDPISIYELAKNMINIAGMVPHKDIDINFIGLRPGEKLHEELYYNHEELLPTEHASITKLSSDKFSDEFSEKFYRTLKDNANDNKTKKLEEMTTKVIKKFKESA